MHRLFALGMSPMAARSGGAAVAEKEAAEQTSRSSGLTITQTAKVSGPAPTATDVVPLHDHGTSPNGEVFDSSVGQGDPARLPLDRVISCWTQGLQQMQVGRKAKLVCPPSIACGALGALPGFRRTPSFTSRSSCSRSSRDENPTGAPKPAGG